MIARRQLEGAGGLVALAPGRLLIAARS
jgi:hypothetical protein